MSAKVIPDVAQAGQEVVYILFFDFLFEERTSYSSRSRYNEGDGVKIQIKDISNKVET